MIESPRPRPLDAWWRPLAQRGGFWLFGVLLIVLSGCDSFSGQGAPAVANIPSTQSPAPLWGREGLEAQPRLDELRERISPELGHEPGATPWRPAELKVPVELTSQWMSRYPGADTAGALLQHLVAAFKLDQALGTELWELTTRLWQERQDSAVGVILQWGLKDDALAGQDLRVHMIRGPAGWYVERLEQREHCRRGVTEEGLCL